MGPGSAACFRRPSGRDDKGVGCCASVPSVLADGPARMRRGQPGTPEQAPRFSHHRSNGPGLDWCEDGARLRGISWKSVFDALG